MEPGHKFSMEIYAIITCLVRCINTILLTREKYPDVVPTMRFDNLKVLR